MGSSATISAGVPIRPMPIIARWRMPPENSCGYWCARRSGSEIRTARSRSTARASAGLRPRPWWWRATSASWPPMRRVGLNEVIGSWNTIASEVPSRCRCDLRVLGPQVGAEQLEPGGVHPAGVADEARDRERGERLARAGLTHDADRLAPAYGEATPRAPGGSGPGGPGKLTSRSRTSSTTSDDASGVVGDGGLGLRRPRPTPRRRKPDATDRADPETLGDGLPEEVEREAGDEDGEPRRERGGGVDVDRADPVVEQTTPVVAGRLDARGRGTRARRRTAARHPRRSSR